jgi:hypothetical protein
MSKLELRPTHKPVQHYYAALRQFDDPGVSYEGALRSLSASTGDLRSLGRNERNSPKVKAPCGPSERARANHWVRVRCRSVELARRSINSNLADAALEEWLTQPLLTERLLRTVFSNPDFS